MKIAYTGPTSVRIQMERGEEMSAVGQVLQAFDRQVTVEIVIAPADPPPASALRMPTEEEDVDPHQEMALFVKDDGMTTGPGMPVPALAKITVGPAKAKRPNEVYVTEVESQVLRLLRQHPDGLTSSQIATLLDMTVSKASVTVWRLRTERPGKDTTTPLVTKVTDGRHRVTALGKNLKLIVVKRPNFDNVKLGWSD